MKSLLSVILLFAGVLKGPTAFASLEEICWPNHATDPLTVSRIMYQFRDELHEADLVVSVGSANPSAVSDTDLQTAANHVATARACAEVVLTSTTDLYWPSSAFEMSGEEQIAYLQSWKDYMTDFHTQLGEYRDRLIAEIQLPVGERTFTELSLIQGQVRETANQAHHHL